MQNYKKLRSSRMKVLLFILAFVLPFSLSAQALTFQELWQNSSGRVLAGTSYSLFTTQAPAGEYTDGVGANYELGMRFTSTVSGQITAVRFWKSAQETGTHTGRIWNATGQQLASVVFSGETASGWQQQNLATPLTIAANTEYLISVNTGNTYYVADDNGLGTQITNQSLRSVVGGNGRYGTSGSYPTQTYMNTNYFRDVVFTPDATFVDTQAPTVPTGLAATAVSSSQIDVSWQAASDNVGVAGYRLYRNGSQIASVLSTSYTDTGLTANTAYSYTVLAYDAAGNASAQSAAATATTQAEIITPPSSSNGAPVLFFTDLVSAPVTGGENNNGAYVTIYGQNFGSAPTVTVGGRPVSIKSGPANWLWYQKMTIQLGGASGSIVVTNNYGASNSLPFAAGTGLIRCVSTSGSDSADGRFSSEGSGHQCWRTVQNAVESMGSGDVVYVLAGVTATTNVRYSAAVSVETGGTASAWKALVAYPGASVTLGTATAPDVEYGIRVPQISDIVTNYWVFAGFTFRGGITAFEMFGSNNWRIVGNDFSCPNANGNAWTSCFHAGESEYIKDFGNYTHDSANLNGPTKGFHEHYFTAETNHVEMAWNEVNGGNGNSCRGVQFHSSPTSGAAGYNQFDLSVHDNYIHNTRCDGLNFATIDPSKGKVEAYNNVITNAGTGVKTGDLSSYTCLYVPGFTNAGTRGSGTVEIFNNTLYNCGAGGGNTAGAINADSADPIYTKLRNNIVIQQNGIPYFAPSSVLSRINGSNNLYYGNGAAPAVTTANLNTNPLLVSLTGGDFHLQSASPAIDAGVAVAGLSRDRDGVSRPQGQGVDLGAHEYASGTTPPPPPATDTQAPTVPTGLVATAVSSSQINLSWTASTDNVGVIGYRLYRNGSQVATTSSTSYTDTGLTANTAYSYTVLAYDAAGNASAQSAAATATTQAGADLTAPSVPTGLIATTVSSSQINLSWTASTDNVGVTGYRIYRNGTQIATTNSNSYSNTGLAASTTYNYTVAAYDAAGNASSQSAAAAATTQAPPDTQAPVISSVQTGNITTSSATVSWSTNEPATSFVDYGLTTSYGQTVGNANLSVSHSVPLSGLSASTTYHFRVRNADQAGNESYSLDQTFTTAADPVVIDTPPAAVTNLAAGQPTRTSLKLGWTAPGNDGNSGTAASYDIRYSRSAITEANWSTATQLTGEPTPSIAGTSQSYVAVGLSSGVRYYFAIKTTDTGGNISALSNVASGVTKKNGKVAYRNLSFSYNGGLVLGETTPDPEAEEDTSPLDITPPAPVSSFKAESLNSQVALSWINPADSDFVRTVIVRSEGTTAPGTAASGTMVYEGTAQSFVDTNVVNGTTYSYSAFAFDLVPNYSTAATAQATPEKSKQQASVPKANSNSVIDTTANTPLPSAGYYSNGSLVNDNGTIYLIVGSTKVPFTNYPAFRGLGYSLKNVVKGSTGAHALAQDYLITSASQSHPWSSWLLRGKTIYYSTEAGMIPVPTWEVFVANGGKSEFVLKMNSADLKILSQNPDLPAMELDDSRLYR